jgi:hypothetical protein
VRYKNGLIGLISNKTRKIEQPIARYQEADLKQSQYPTLFRLQQAIEQRKQDDK